MFEMLMVEPSQTTVLHILTIGEGSQGYIAHLFLCDYEKQDLFHYTKEQILHGQMHTNAIIL